LLDFYTGEYSLIVFYLIPVSLESWFVGKRSGVMYCFLAAAVRIVADETFKSFSFQYSSLHYWNIFIEFLFLLIMALLFSALRKTLDIETTLARHDPLTGALNRRSFFTHAEYELMRAGRYGHPLSIAYIDLDNFKTINDSLGHQTGDRVLTTVVDTIKANMRTTDVLSRFGGDEFVILLPESGAEAATAFLDKMFQLLRQVMSHNSWSVDFSIGSVTYNRAPATIDEVVHQADELMYQVKRSGKGRILHIVAD